jgi:hypothetical protein
MCRISILLWIANAAARFSGRHGAVTRQVQHQGCSRQSVYNHAGKVYAALELEHSGSPTRDHLLRDNAQLRDENRQLWEWLDQTVEFPLAKRQEFTVKAAAMGLSLNQILELLAVILGVPAIPGRSTVHRWVQAASQAAGRVLNDLDQRCQSLVSTACLDEIFFHGRPVFVGVEPASMTLILAEKSDRLCRRAWIDRLQRWPALRYVVSDAGVLLQSAIAWVQARRKAGVAALKSSLDVFHTAKEARRVLKILWNRVRKAWKTAEQADRKVAKAKRAGRPAHGPANAARSSWDRVAQFMGQYDEAQRAWQTAKTALELFRPDGRLNDRAWAWAQVQEALPALRGQAWTTLRHLLQDHHAFTFLDRLHQRLAELPIDTELRQALARLWWLRRRARGGDDQEHHTQAILLQEVLCAKLDPHWERWYGPIAGVLRTTVRASSAVECVNSVLRMHQSRHRNLGQGLLDLKRLYWNTRGFRNGWRRGQCPYQLLGLDLPAYDFWELLRSVLARSPTLNDIRTGPQTVPS